MVALNQTDSFHHGNYYTSYSADVIRGMLPGQQESGDSIGISASHNGELGIQALSYCSKSPVDNLQPVKAVKVQKDDFDRMKINNASSFTFNFPKITILLALVSKNLTKMIRNCTGLFFIFLLPAIETILYCVAIGNDPKSLPFGIVNHEVREDFTPKGPSMSFYPDFIQILSRFYPDFIQILCRFYSDFIQVLYRVYPDFILILSRYFKNSLYPNFIQILS